MKREQLYQVTLIEQDMSGCCHDCDPSFGSEYEEVKFITETELKELNDWGYYPRLKHLRMLSPHEMDAYQGGIDKAEADAQSGKYLKDKQTRIKNSEALLLVMNHLGEIIRDQKGLGDINNMFLHFGEIKYALGNAFEPEVFDELAIVIKRGLRNLPDVVAAWFKSDDEASWNWDYKDLVDAIKNPKPVLADWEKEILGIQEEDDNA